MVTRLTAKEVEEIRYTLEHDNIPPPTSQAIRLCESHEVYRYFAQRFIDIYSGAAAQKIERSGATVDLKPLGTQDTQQVLLFQLFLEIVGPIPPKV